MINRTIRIAIGLVLILGIAIGIGIGIRIAKANSRVDNNLVSKLQVLSLNLPGDLDLNLQTELRGTLDRLDCKELATLTNRRDLQRLSVDQRNLSQQLDRLLTTSLDLREQNSSLGV